MSPEQASGGAVDARSDVFSFGAVLYEMVTGRRPFGGSSSAEMLASLLKEQPQPPSELVPEVPRDLERIILRCLRKEPERRFQHMLDVKVELQEAKEESDSQATAPGGAAVARRRSRRRAVAWTAAAILILATATGVALWRLRRPELPAPRLVQLTWSGHETQATFSPDGSQIAFASDGDDGGRPGIWLKIVGKAEARRLTTGPVDGGPAWSPDGGQIAFARSASGTNSIHVVSPLGVSETRLLDFPAPGLFTGYQLPWSPDGRWLAAARGRTKGDTTPESGGIHLVPVGGGEPHAVTFPKPPALDVCPAFSPDGRALAYATCERWAGGGAAACDINIMTLDTQFRPAAAARRLPGPKAWVQGLAWTRDGRSIVFGVNEIPRSYLWRVRADGTTPPERMELAGRGAVYPSTAKGRDRLAFVRNLWDVDVHRVQLGSSPAPLIQSTFNEYNPQYSPDGRRIAFESGRSGDAEEIWLAEADGSNPMQLTHGPGRGQGSPRWSPDGRSIAFDSRGEDGHSDIWTIGVDGAGLRRVTRDPSDESIPSWSRDGSLVYFTSTRAGREEVWRAPAAGGAGERVTREGGCAASESLDGRLLYYVRTSANDALLVRPTAGGEERTIARCADLTNYAVGPQGVFYVGCNPPEAPFGSHRVVRHWDAATGLDRPVAEIEGNWVAGLSVSPDGRTIAWGRSLVTSDLMMIEDFR